MRDKRALAFPAPAWYNKPRICRRDGIGRRDGLKRRQLPLSSAKINDRKSLEESGCFGNPERLSFFEGASVADRLTRESIRTHFPTKKHLCRCGGIGRRPGFKIQCPQGRAGSTPATGTIRESRKPCSMGAFGIFIFNSGDEL